MELKKHYLLFGILFTFILINIIRLQNFYACIHDDYYIFLRYADNFIKGYGLVFNQLGERVEGFSSFLYLLVVIVFRSIGISNHEFIPYIGILFSSLTIVYLFLILLESKTNSTVNYLITFFLIINPIFVFNSTTGMDTSLFTFLITVIIYYYIKYYKKLSIKIFVFLTLLILVRSESFLIIFTIIFFTVIKEKYINKNPEVNRQFHFYLIYSIILMMLIIVFRNIYFNSIIPNTLKAKSGFEIQQIIGGVEYTYRSYKLIFGSAGILLIFPILYSIKKVKNDDTILISLLIILVFTLSIIFIGGDHFEFGRYFMPVIPFILILIGKGLEEIFLYVHIRYIQVIIIFLLISLVVYKSAKTFAYTKPFEIFYQEKSELNSLKFYSENIKNKMIDDNRIGMLSFREMGKTLHNIGNSNSSIACVPIGAIGYFSNFRIFDMVGLVESKIADENFDSRYIKTWRPGHDKGDGNYILSQKPDFIQLTDYFTRVPQKDPGDHAMQYKSIVEIWNSKNFHNDYRFFPIQLGNGWYYNLYKKK